MKYKYSLNNKNQLLIKSTKMKKPLRACGRFAVTQDNRLIYWLNEPISWRRIYDLSRKISFQGNWRINPNYDLELILDESRQQYKDNCLSIKGKIISTDQDSLIFEIKSYDKKGLLHIQLLKLSGLWQADEYSRLCFVAKKGTSPDILTLEGEWQINKNQQIIYTYDKAKLKKKIKTSDTLTFEGFWQIHSANRLTYILSRSTKSTFDFRAQIETPNLYPQEGVIKYRLGIGIRQVRSHQDKIISLYGTWKFSRKFGLLFLMDYGLGKTQSIEFSTEVHLTKKDEIIFSLFNKRKESLGFYITFSHKFLKKHDAQAFLRLRKFQEETGIQAGMQVPF